MLGMGYATKKGNGEQGFGEIGGHMSNDVLA
jgi:hypothetical protein